MKNTKVLLTASVLSIICGSAMATTNPVINATSGNTNTYTVYLSNVVDGMKYMSFNDPKNQSADRSYLESGKIKMISGDFDNALNGKGMTLVNNETLDSTTYDSTGLSAQVGNTAVKFTTNGIDAGMQRISRVKAGVNDTDAVNVSQLKQYVADNDKDTITTVKSADSNVVVNNDGNHNYTVGLNKNITGESITITNSEGTKTVALNPTGLDNGGNTITNVGKGINDTDAANVEQLKEVENKITSVGGNVLSNAKSYTDAQVGKVGANAAALSALHPLDFNPDDKWQFSVGYGNYKGSNAAAVGAFYQPNENVLLSVGTTFGTGDNMVNAGATVRFGSHSKMNTNKQVAVAKEVQDLKLQLATISQKYDNLVTALKSSSAIKPDEFELKDVPQDH